VGADTEVVRVGEGRAGATAVTAEGEAATDKCRNMDTNEKQQMLKGYFIMRQKYTICREKNKETLSIKEYAILEKVPRNQVVSMSGEDLFSFIGEETYDSSTIENSIGEGINALAAALRTKGMFPIWPNAIRIAESVMEMYDLDTGGAMDLFFDDMEQLDQSWTTAI